MDTIQKYFLLLVLSTLIYSCNNTSVKKPGSIKLPPEIAIPESLIESLSSIVTTVNPIDYSPSESKTADTDILTPEDGYKQLVKLYPNKGKRVDAWTKLNKYFVFSLRSSDKVKNTYLHILYVPIGGRKFTYFGFHT